MPDEPTPKKKDEAGQPAQDNQTAPKKATAAQPAGQGKTRKVTFIDDGEDYAMDILQATLDKFNQGQGAAQPAAQPAAAPDKAQQAAEAAKPETAKTKAAEQKKRELTARADDLWEELDWLDEELDESEDDSHEG